MKLFAGLNSTPHPLNYFEYTTVTQSESSDILFVSNFILIATKVVVENCPYKLYYGETLKLFSGLNSTPHLLNYFEYITVAQSEPNPILLVVDFLLVVIQTAVEHHPY